MVIVLVFINSIRIGVPTMVTYCASHQRYSGEVNSYDFFTYGAHILNVHGRK